MHQRIHPMANNSPIVILDSLHTFANGHHRRYIIYRRLPSLFSANGHHETFIFQFVGGCYHYPHQHDDMTNSINQGKYLFFLE